MNFATVHAAELRPALSALRRLSLDRTMGSSQARLTTLPGHLEITVATCDLPPGRLCCEATVRVPLAEPSPSVGKVIVVARKSLDELARASDIKHVLTLSIEPGHGNNEPHLAAVFISQGFRDRRTLMGYKDGDLPTVAIATPARSIGLSSDHVAALIAALPFCSEDSTREVLNGAYLHRDGTGRLTSTDGRRMLHQPFPAPPADLIVPRGALFVLAAPWFAGCAMKLTVPPQDDLGHQPVELAGPKGRIRFQGIDGNFPNYRAVLPPEEATVGTAVLTPENAARVATWLRRAPTNKQAPSVRVHPRGNVLHLSTHASGAKLAAIQTPAAVIGVPPSEIAFNPSFFADALDAGFHSIDFTDSYGSCPAVGRRGLARMVLMPMRVMA